MLVAYLGCCLIQLVAVLVVGCLAPCNGCALGVLLGSEDGCAVGALFSSNAGSAAGALVSSDFG